MCSYVQIVMLLVSFVRDTLYSFPSDIQKDDEFLIWILFLGFSFCVCLRACVCAWVQSLDWDHCWIKHQFSVCVVSHSSNRVDCAHWHFVKNPDLCLAASHHSSLLSPSPSLLPFQSVIFLQITNFVSTNLKALLKYRIIFCLFYALDMLQ